MSTYRYVSNIIQKTLKLNFATTDISINQINFWIQVVANRLRYQRLNGKGGFDRSTGLYLSVFEGVVVNVVGAKKYIEFPQTIIDIDKDGGVEYISYEDDTESNVNPVVVQFERTTYPALRNAYNIPLISPKPSSPFFYRSGKRAYLVGIQNVSIETVQVGIHTLVDPYYVLDMDDEVPIDESQDELLITRVLANCRFGLLVSTQKEFEGSDLSGDQKNKTAISQVEQQQG